MANTREELVNRFFAINGAGKIQAALGTAQPNADIDTRDKCTITREEIIVRRDLRDCRNEDMVGSDILTRLARYTLVYAEITPQILSRWFALYLGGAANPTGAQANEIQAITRVGTVSGGGFKLRATLEGRSVTTKIINWDDTTALIQSKLTAARMRFIHPGDVVVSSLGVKQKETLVIVGTASGSGDLPVTVKAAGSVALSGAGKTINVAILTGDIASVVAGKVRVALAADTDVAAFFAVTGAGANVVLEALAAAANDSTMDVSNTAVLGMTAASSANTTAGVATTGWGSTGMIATFGGRLAHADIPILEVVESTVTGGGSIAVTQITAGSQNFHGLTRATSRVKLPFTFALGYEDAVGTIEKYADYVCESFQPSASLDGDPALTVTILGPWEYDSLEPTLTIPDCVNPTPLRTEDCTVEINSVFETADVNSVTNNLNDNVPLDRLSAFAYDGIDVQRLLRGKQPTYTAAASLFGLAGAGSDTAPAVLAQNERSQAAVPVIEHYGLPGNRFSLIYPNGKVRFQTNRETYVGAVEFTAVNLDIVPFKDGTAAPVKGEAYVDQATAFLVASS